MKHAFIAMKCLKFWPHKYLEMIELCCPWMLHRTDHTQSGCMSGLQLYAEQCTLISLSLLSHTYLHGCHNYHTKEYHSDTMHKASRRCSFMNPSDSNWLALLHKTCSCLCTLTVLFLLFHRALTQSWSRGSAQRLSGKLCAIGQDTHLGKSWQ